MNENKLREMMKIYTVSKQVNKKAEKNFLKFSSQYYKMHKDEITPDFLNEINSLRNRIKVERETFSRQTSPQYSPRMTGNPSLFNPFETKQQQFVDTNQCSFCKLYVEEIDDLKQQLNQANQRIEKNQKMYQLQNQELQYNLEKEQQKVKILNQQIKEVKTSSKLVNEFLNSDELLDPKIITTSQEQKQFSNDQFKLQVQKALEKYQYKQINKTNSQ